MRSMPLLIASLLKVLAAEVSATAEKCMPKLSKVSATELAIGLMQNDLFICFGDFDNIDWFDVFFMWFSSFL